MTSFKLTWRGDAVGRVAAAAGMKGLHQGAETIIGEAVQEAPVEWGTLRRSYTVTDAPGEGRVYGSFNTPYAVRQHEELEWRHPLGGKAKYLEDPFKRLSGRVRQLVHAAVKAALRGAR